MDIVKGILLVLHIIGFGAVFGATLGQLMNLKTGTARVSNGIMHGALLLLVTGLALVGIAYPMGNGDLINNAKIGVKLVILIVLFVVVLMNRKKEKAAGGVLGAILALSAANVAIAVLW